MDASRPWSPIAAVEAAKAGSRVAAPIGGAWHLTQAWKSLTPLSGGHARLSYADPSDPYNLLVLESSSKLNLVGPTWTRTTWATLQKQYPAGVRAIALRSE